MNKDQIREIFMQHGFTIKDGKTDLKPYVYEAAYALLAAQPAADAPKKDFLNGWREAIQQLPVSREPAPSDWQRCDGTVGKCQNECSAPCSPDRQGVALSDDDMRRLHNQSQMGWGHDWIKFGRLVEAEALSRASSSRAEVERDSEWQDIGRLLHKAAGSLPDGYEIQVRVERGWGGVVLHGTDDESTDLDDGESSLSEQIERAIDAAMLAAEAPNKD